MCIMLEQIFGLKTMRNRQEKLISHTEVMPRPSTGDARVWDRRTNATVQSSLEIAANYPNTCQSFFVGFAIRANIAYFP